MTDSKSKLPKITIPAVIIILALVILYFINSTKTSKNGYEPNVAFGAEKQSQSPASSSSAPKKATLADVVKTARTWEPAFQTWYGKPAPDFTLKDIAGKEHKLSSYLGKNVMVVFWATWCGPCRMEIPYLKQLRSAFADDKLAILALSNEDASTVSKFAERNGINYAVFSVKESDIKSPFNAVRGIPTTFFIDPQGKIKIAAMGSMELDDMKLILSAQ